MLLTIKTLAAQLSVKRSTLYSWVRQGKIPALKINGVIRFEEHSIERWLQSCQTPTERPARSAKSWRTGATRNVDHLIERVNRAIYTQRGETRPIASPFREEERNGAL